MSKTEDLYEEIQLLLRVTSDDCRKTSPEDAVEHLTNLVTSIENRISMRTRELGLLISDHEEDNSLYSQLEMDRRLLMVRVEIKVLEELLDAKHF